MSVAQFVVSAVISILATLPAVLLIPRARQSPTFDRVLWIGTAAFAFLSAWFVLGNLSANFSALNGWVVGEVAIVPALLGAAFGAFALNGLLWLMDLSGRSHLDDDLEADELSQDSTSPPAMDEESNNIKSPVDLNSGH